MQNSISVSLIIPVYNAQEWLEATLLSAVAQTLTDIEIIVINDGSTDESQTLIDAFQTAHPSKIKSLFQPNEGLSSARNRGILMAQGEYLSFLDSDDTLSPSALEEMYLHASAFDLEIVTCGYRYCYEDETLVHYTPYTPDDKKTLFEAILSSSITTMACSRLYKTSLFHHNDIFFPHGKIYEDLATLYKLIHVAHSTGVIQQPLYTYYCRPHSLSTKLTKKHIDDMFDVLLETKLFLEKHHLLARYEHHLLGRYLRQFNGLFRFIHTFSNTHQEELLSYLRIKLHEHHLMDKSIYHAYATFNNALVNTFLKYTQQSPYPFIQAISTESSLLDLKNTFSHETCFVIGNPAYLLDEDIKKLTNKNIFCANSSIADTRVINIVNFYILTNKNAVILSKYTPIKTIFTCKSLAPYCEPSAKYSYFSDHLKKDTILHFSDDLSKGLYHGYSSMWIVFQLIAHFGFSRVCLIGIGCDSNALNEKCIDEWQGIKQVFDKLSIPIYNATKSSHLQIFEHATLDSYLSL